MAAITFKSNTVRMIVIGALVVGAFFGAYRFASAKGGAASSSARNVAAARGAATPAGAGGAAAGAAGTTCATGTAAGSASAGGSGCACCGSSSASVAKNGVTGAAAEGIAKVSGDVQTISVKVTSVYNPSVIRLKAGVPARVSFSQASGCTAQVQSAELGFNEDLSAGPKTIKLPALKAGTYSFSCGMNMVFGKIVVK